MKNSAFSPPGLMRHLVYLLPALGLVFTVFSGTLDYSFVNRDDPHYVEKNPYIFSLSPQNVKEIFSRPHFHLYIPVTMLSYALDYQFYGFDPFGYHWGNLLLHLANVALVYILVFFLARDWLIALGAALIFGVHPVQVESVVWISERKNVLSAFFFFVTLFCYAEAKRGTKYSGRAEKLGWVFFLLACLAKPGVVSLPLLLMAFDHCFDSSPKRKWRGYAPYFAIAALTVLISAASHRGSGLIAYFGGSFERTMLAMAVAMMKYFELIFYPLNLHYFYVFPVYRSVFEPAVLFSVIGLMGLALIFWLLHQKDKKIFFWGAWYLILLLPVSNIIPFPSLMNDRYLYLPIIGMTVLVLAGLKRFVGALPAGILLLVSVVSLSFITLQRQLVWAPGRILKQNIRLDREDQYRVYLKTGVYFLKKGLSGHAVDFLKKALAARETAAVYGYLGAAYLQMDQYDLARGHLEKAMALDPAVSGYRNDLAVVYMKQGRLEDAIKEMRQAVSMAPQDLLTRSNLAGLLAETGRKDESLAELEAAAKINPDFYGVLFNLGVYYFEKGRMDLARRYWTRFLDLYPDYPGAEEVKSRLKQMAE